MPNEITLNESKVEKAHSGIIKEVMTNKTSPHTSTLLLIALVYFGTAAGHVDTVDTDPSMETARSLVQHGSLSVNVPNPDPALYAKSNNGRVYSKLGWLLPVLYVPSVWLAQGSSIAEGFLVSLTHLLFGWLTLWVLMKGCARLNRSELEIKYSLLMLGLGSFWWAYSKSTHRDTVTGFFLLCGYSQLLTQKRGRTQQVGTFFSLALWTNPATLIPVLPGLALLLKRRNWKDLSTIALSIFGLFLISETLYGNPVGMGYSKDTWSLDSSVWSTPFWWGIYRQFFHPQSSIFIYAPGLIFAFATLLHSARKRTFDASIVLPVCFCLTAIFYAKWWTPLGGAALGPRYLVSVLPLMFLYLNTSQFLNPTEALSPVKNVLKWTCLTSICFMSIQTAIKPMQYWSLKAVTPIEIESAHWAANIYFFRNKIEGRPEVYQATELGAKDRARLDLTQAKSLQGLNYWWLHGLRHLRSKKPLARIAPHDPLL